MSNPVISWAKDHPVAAGGAALGIIVVVMLLTGGTSDAAQSDGASGGMGGAGVSAYYVAVAQQSQAGAAVQIAQIQANAGTNKALIAANYGLESQKTQLPLQKQALDIQARQVDNDLTLGSKALDYGYGVATNQIALENAKLTQEQNIAFKKINATKKTWFDSLLSAATTIVPAVATGGASLGVQGLGSFLGGSSAAASTKLPSLGSSGQWV